VRAAWAARGGHPAGPAAAEGFPQALRETST